MKVAIILPMFTTGGAESVVAQLATNMDRSKFDIAVISMGPRQNHFFERKIEEAGIPVYYMDKTGSKSPRAMLRLWHLLSKMKPDVVHTHLHACFYALPWVLTHRAKMVHTIHIQPDKEFNPRKRKIMRLGVKIHKIQPVTLSKVNQQVAAELYHCDPEEYPYVNNPVELQHYWHEDRGPDGDFVFINVSRMDRRKNLSLAVRAMPEVLRRIPNAKLVLVGNGETFEELHREAAELGVQDAVVFTGEQEHPEEYLARADVYVMPSQREGLPLSVLEGMASGLPVVSTNVGGMADLVKDNGALIESNDLEALTREMIRLGEDRELWERCSAASRRIVKEFEAPACAAAYERIYTKVCPKGRR